MVEVFNDLRNHFSTNSQKILFHFYIKEIKKNRNLIDFDKKKKQLQEKFLG